MPRKGTAKVKKSDRYVYFDESDESPVNSGSDVDVLSNTSQTHTKTEDLDSSDHENVDPTIAREPQKLSIKEQLKPAHRAGQPRQDSPTVKQRPPLANSLVPNKDSSTTATDPPSQLPCPAASRPCQKRPSTRTPNSSTPRSRTSGSGSVGTDANLAEHTQDLNLTRANCSRLRQISRSAAQDTGQILVGRDTDMMIQGGASIPANQQRNMRACMVCSIVRTQQQFMTQGCPNCEDIIELANNLDQINDCTSQVFEGLISVADTSRSWVARYQRLEGYVPGVYATQVEGILPEDVLSAVENAGINYVPRDGSEQEMLGKD